MPFQSAPRNSPVGRFASLLAALTLTLLAGGCGGMNGTYEADGSSGDRLEFKGDKVYITIPPAPTMAGEYEIDDDKVIIKVSGQSMALTRRGDALEGGPFGTTFVRK